MRELLDGDLEQVCYALVLGGLIRRRSLEAQESGVLLVVLGEYPTCALTETAISSSVMLNGRPIEEAKDLRRLAKTLQRL